LPVAAALVVTGSVPDPAVTGTDGSHRVGYGYGYRRRVPAAAASPAPVTVEPAHIRLFLTGSVPDITVNDDELVLALAA